MHSCLVVIILLFQTFCFASSQKIVLLYGSSCSGKTSLCKEVERLDCSWLHIDEDDIYIEEWLKEIASSFPAEYECISKAISDSNLFHAVKRNVILFKERATSKERSLALESITTIQTFFQEEGCKEFREKFREKFISLTLDAIEQGLINQKNILLNRWYLSHDQITKTFPDIPTSKVFAFSPLVSSLEKFNKRNSEAFLDKDLSNHRFYKQFIPSYISLYQIKTTPTDIHFPCKRKDLDTLFESIYQDLLLEEKIVNPGILSVELSKMELEEFRKKFIPKYLLPNETIYITPSREYDIIINTHQKTPDQIAEDLLLEIKKTN